MIPLLKTMSTSLLNNQTVGSIRNLGFSGNYPTSKVVRNTTKCSDGSCRGDCTGSCWGSAAGG